MRVTTYNTTYGAIILVHMPRAVFTAAVALGHHHLGDFYTPDGALCSANNLRAQVPRGYTVDTIRTWLQQHNAVPRPPDGSSPSRRGCQARYGRPPPQWSLVGVRPRPPGNGR